MTPLLPITFPSIYKVNGVAVPLPKRMAQCTPDMKLALARAAQAIGEKGGRLVLSDLFRSYDMQLGSHMDFKSGKKTAFSPPPGGSLHEAGRALDLDLGALKMPLDAFWVIAKTAGLTPIIDQPNAKKSEAWHFECRGSHTLVYDYYKAGKGSNFDSPYKAMAASAIVSIGVRVDRFAERQQDAYIQSALIRLGHQLGNMDGQIGPRTRDALAAAGLEGLSGDAAIAGLDHKLQAAFPDEFFDKTAADPSFIG
jgi:D-alanyl-D-alanine dipeptidase